MHKLRVLAVVTATALLSSACGTTDTPEPDTEPAAAGLEDEATAGDELRITDPRSRMSPRLTASAAVYLGIENPTDDDVVLVGAQVPTEIAARAELHETYEVEDEGMDGDADGDLDPAAGGMHGGDEGAAAPMMGMREIPSIEIPAGGAVELRPGGLHVMVLDLVEELTPGTVFDLTLEFEDADPVTVAVEVREEV
jgi:periplasmic copper chaperone A